MATPVTAPPSGKKIVSVNLLAGAISGMISSLCTQPFDVMKTRMIMGRGRDYEKYRTLTQTVKTVVKEEGFFALWKGVTPALWRVVPSAC